jgi:hypothetical protein
MQQKQIISALKLHISSRQIPKFETSRVRMKYNNYCPHIRNYFLKCSGELITQLDSLINENDIELSKLRELGLYEAVRNNAINYSPSAIIFELQLLRNFKVKEKVIDNMLLAANMIDYSTMIAV